MSKARVAVLKVITKELTVTAAAAKYGYSRQGAGVAVLLGDAQERQEVFEGVKRPSFSAVPMRGAALG